MGSRTIKRRIYDLLKSQDFEKTLQELNRIPARKVINSLFSFLQDSDQHIKWSAVKAMGAAVRRLADEDMESARIILRRLMWNLNDESGGIGWGSPEAMGEILALHEGLAGEYAHVLISYTRENGNYLEQELLQRGLLWGIGRLSQVRPHLLQDAKPYLMAYLESPDAVVRGLAVWIMGILRVEEALSKVQALKKDQNAVWIYMEPEMINCRVKDLAKEAWDAIRT